MVGLQAYAMQPGLHGTGINPRSVRLRQILYPLSSTSSPTSLFIAWLWKRRGLFYTGCWTKHSWGSHIPLRRCRQRVRFIRTTKQSPGWVPGLVNWGREHTERQRWFWGNGAFQDRPVNCCVFGALAAAVWMSPPRLVGWKVIAVAAMLGGGTRWERSWGWVDSCHTKKGSCVTWGGCSSHIQDAAFQEPSWGWSLGLHQMLIMAVSWV